MLALQEPKRSLIAGKGGAGKLDTEQLIALFSTPAQ